MGEKAFVYAIDIQNWRSADGQSLRRRVGANLRSLRDSGKFYVFEYRCNLASNPNLDMGRENCDIPDRSDKPQIVIIDVCERYFAADRGDLLVELQELAKQGAEGYVIIIWSVDGDIIRYDVGQDTNGEGLPSVYTTACRLVMDE